MELNLLKKLQQNDDRGDAVCIVITINHHLFIPVDGPYDSINGLVHILHQERIVQVMQRRRKIAAGIVRAADVAA